MVVCEFSIPSDESKVLVVVYSPAFLVSVPCNEYPKVSDSSTTPHSFMSPSASVAVVVYLPNNTAAWFTLWLVPDVICEVSFPSSLKIEFVVY